MPRARNSVQTRARHKKWIKRAKGYRGRRRKVFKIAKEAVLKAGQHAYYDRRKKKATRRQQWQTTIGAAARQHNLTYSQLIGQLKKEKVALNRKMLAEIAVKSPKLFEKIISTATKK